MADSLLFYHHGTGSEKQHEVKVKRSLFLVNTIHIIILEPSGTDILDTARHKNKFLDKVINKSHKLTRQKAVKFLLLFSTGDTITTENIVESERLLRKYLKIRDARIIVTARGNSRQCNVTVIIQDLIALNFGLNNINTITSYSIADRNFLGFGSNIYGSVSYIKQKYSHTSLYFEDPSLFNTYLNLSVSYSTADSNFTNGIRLNKNFVSGLFTWAGGGGYSYKNSNQNIYLNSEITGRFNSELKQTDAWLGKAYKLDVKSRYNHNSIKNILVSGRFIKTVENLTKLQLADSLGVTTINKTSHKLLFSLGYISRRYYKDSYIFRFKYAEDIPEGFLFSVLAGQSFNKFYSNNYYAGFTTGIANNNKSGYWNLSYQYVKSISFNANFDNGVHAIKLFYLSPLFVKQKFKDRILINSKFQKIGNDLVYNRLYLNNDDGFLNINSRLLSGLVKASLNLTNIIYTPFKPLGFNVGFFTYAALANINTTNEITFKSNWYQSYGVGILLRNENLLINSIRIAFTFYPSFPTNTYKFNPLWIYELQIPEMGINQPEFEIN